MRRPAIALLVCGILLAGTGFPAVADIVVDLGRGPVTVHVPPSYDPEIPTPLVCLLHGYGSSGYQQESYFQFTPLADEHGFIYLYPDGTFDANNNRFWNATDACCNFYGSSVDDSGYLMALIDEIRIQLNVDPRRIFFAGHSNGGFMSYRMACDHSETVAAIASLAGATYADPADCSPDSPVHVLQIHGTADTVIFYEGGTIQVPYPGAVETVEQWAQFGDCLNIGVLTPPPLDLDSHIPGDETTVHRYDMDCHPDGSAELWSIVGGSHVPSFTENFAPLVIEFLLGHPKSSPAVVEEAWVKTTPNPIIHGTRIRYQLAEASPVALAIHDVAGRVIRSLVRGEEQVAGHHEVAWDGCGKDGVPLASGIYFVSLESRRQSVYQRLIIAK